MSCTCHDPVVFGHHHQPPTYGSGETFTIGNTEIYIQGADGQPVRIGNAGHLTLSFARINTQTTQAAQASRTFIEPAQTAHGHLEATHTAWNWLEPSHTHPNYTQPPGTGEPCG